MKKQILFIQGGGDGGYEEDEKLKTALQTVLGASYEVHYPRMPSNETLGDFGWVRQIENEIIAINGEIILVGHSLGASMLLKYLSENQLVKKIAGIFLIATPFWSGDEDWVEGLKLQPNFAERLDKKTPLFFYHCCDDKEVPFAHLANYKQQLRWANFLEIDAGGHQLNNDLTLVADDIKEL